MMNLMNMTGEGDIGKHFHLINWKLNIHILSKNVFIKIDHKI